jgi:hypothetical protein
VEEEHSSLDQKKTVIVSPVGLIVHKTVPI